MIKRSFYVRAVWGPEVKRHYSESDIWGLHIETDTIEEFEEVMNDVAAELIVANHISPADLANTPIQELVPTIVWERPVPARRVTICL